MARVKNPKNLRLEDCRRKHARGRRSHVPTLASHTDDKPSVLPQTEQRTRRYDLKDWPLYYFKGHPVPGPEIQLARIKNFLTDEGFDRTADWPSKVSEVAAYLAHIERFCHGRDWRGSLYECVAMLETHLIWDGFFGPRPHLAVGTAEADSATRKSPPGNVQADGRGGPAEADGGVRAGGQHPIPSQSQPWWNLPTSYWARHKFAPSRVDLAIGSVDSDRYILDRSPGDVETDMAFSRIGD